MAVVGRSFVFAFFSIDCLHLLFETQLLHHLLHASCRRGEEEGPRGERALGMGMELLKTH